MRKIAFFILIFSCCLSMTACGKKDDDIEWGWSEKIAQEIQEDGWVYTFEYIYPKDGEGFGAELIPYTFYGVNLRYRYNNDYTTTINVMENGEVVAKQVPQTIQILGQSNSAAIRHDMAYLDEWWNSGDITNEKLLSLTEEDLPFEELDKELFLQLVKTALDGEAHREGNYIDIPSYALLTEPEYLDDYKFQIGFLASMGCLDVIYIDVLYETGASYHDYVQLSDIIDDGAASEEQVQAFDLLKSISDGIVHDNDLQFDKKNNQDKIIADIDFARLYRMLENIEKLDYNAYIIEPKDILE